MLQQTRVVTVIPYYQKWIRLFPNLRTLAQAPLSKILHSWAGLGYYRRAHKLHQAARYVLKNLGGHIPRTARDLAKLPGIGPYTAGAIASIAFGEKVPILDGNVMRILTRIFAISQSIDQVKTLKKLWKIAVVLLPDQNPGDFNQSLMELGATVCLPLNPQCHQCPIKTLCRAHQQNKECFYPVHSRKEKQERLHWCALVIRNRKNEVWLEKQSQGKRWSGLWMFPFWESKREMLQEFQGLSSHITQILTIQQAFTQYRIQLDVYQLDLRKEILPRHSGGWVPIKKLDKIAFPAPHKKMMAYCQQRYLRKP